jgi:hypothetical protein
LSEKPYTMNIRYRKMLEELGVDLNDSVLDPAFVTKAKDFEERLHKKALTEDEIASIDDELCKMIEGFDIKVEDSEELAAEKRKNRILDAKEKISAAATIEELEAIGVEYADVEKELANYKKARVQKLQKQIDDQARQNIINQTLAELPNVKYEDLEEIRGKWKDYPEVVAAIDKRIKDEKPADPPKTKTLREKLSEAKRQEWTYEQLEAIGITPTGLDMTVEGVYLQKIFLMKTYRIVAVDGKNV